MGDHECNPILKCAESFEYFCEDFVKITHPIKGLIPFHLFDFQKRYVKHLDENNYVISKKWRQGGFTTTTMVWHLWKALFNPDQRIMCLGRSDGEAIELTWILHRAIDELPEFLKERITSKNDHKIEFTNGSKIHSRTMTSCCGMSCNHLFIDEAAFVPKMEVHWKAIYPCLSKGAHVTVLSTTNGTGNWFYDTYCDASRGDNMFEIFESEFREHPDYDNEEWIEEVKKNLGPKGWHQEMLTSFFVPDDSRSMAVPKGIENELNYWVEDEAKRIRLLDSKMWLNKNCKKNAYYEHLRKLGRTFGGDMTVYDNHKFVKLTYENDISLEFPKSVTDTESQIRWQASFRIPDIRLTRAKEVEEQIEGLKDDTKSHEFEKLTFEETQRLFNEQHSNCEERSSLQHPEFEKPPEYWWEKAENVRRERNKLESKIQFATECPELLVLAGLADKDEIEEIPTSRPGLKLLHKLMDCGELSKNIELTFFDDRLCVNDVPTVIKEDDLRDAYNGLSVLRSPEEALEEVYGLMKEKLKVLFRKE